MTVKKEWPIIYNHQQYINMEFLILKLFLISLEKNLVDSNEEYVSYNVDLLFSSIPLSETIDFTLETLNLKLEIKF